MSKPEYITAGRAGALLRSYMQVATIIIEGQVCRDMYDEHPGLAYFYTAGLERVYLPRVVPLVAAQAFAEAAWRRRQLRVADQDERAQYDGQFTPTRILLLDRDRSILQCFENERWVTEFDAPEQWPELLATARELYAEAAVESGWDNFSTAASLRERADDLRRRVAIARANQAASVEATPGGLRGQAARILLVLSRVACGANTQQADWYRTQAKVAAETMGFCERQQGAVTEGSPLLFRGEPELQAAWLAGQQFAAELEARNKCVDCQDPEQPCPVHG